MGTSTVGQQPTPVTFVAEQGPSGPPGVPGPPGPPGAGSYVFTQAQPALVWTIVHGLNRYPSVTTVDTAGDQVWGDLHYRDTNTAVLTFSAPVAGSAYLN